MRFSDYLASNVELLTQDWMQFVAQPGQSGEGLSYAQRLDSCRSLLTNIAQVMTASHQAGLQDAHSGKDAALLAALHQVARGHAEDRFSQGCTLQEAVAEFQAFRANAIHKWGYAHGYTDPESTQEIIRFSHAIDQVLAIAVDCFTEELTRARDLFAGILAHDLRTPLGAIQNSASYLLQDTSLSPRARAAAARTERSATRMQLLIGDLLDFTRIRLGRELPMGLHPVDLLLVAEDVVAEIAATFPEARIDVTYGEDLHGFWDGGRIEQLLANLLSNAAQHGDGSVRLAIHKHADRMILQVSNGGRPILPERLEKIFDPFVQDATSQMASVQAGSVGLGLYIAKAIAVAHQGNISVHSDEHKTTFVVDIPLRTLPESERAT